MYRNKTLIVLVLLITLIVLPANAFGTTTLKLIKGNNSIDNAIAVAKELNSSTNTYIIATNDDYPDALAGTVLAGKYNSPILFVTKGNNQKVYDYLAEENANSATRFYILGGTSAVTQTVENKLRLMSNNVTRLGGANRYETDEIINDYLSPKANTPVIIATGLTYPDALAMGAIGGQLQYPIFLVNKNSVPQNIANKLKAIKPSTIYIAGQTVAVPQAIENQLKTLLPASRIERIGGANRYETSQEIENYFSNNLSQRIYTTGKDFHNALISAPLAVKNKASILLKDNITYTQYEGMLNQAGYQVGDITVKTTQNDRIPAITELSEADIERLLSYPTYGEEGKGLFESFEDYYNNPHNLVESFSNEFTPATFSLYENAKVEWLSSPNLIYGSWTGQDCFRGILTLTYYGENSFNLTPNIPYQREVEYRLRNTSIKGKITLILEQIIYLSDWQAVK